MKQHLKTTERPFIIEIIDERFDNISTILTDNAVVYGSSITSIISGLKADGDLDISVSHIEFMTLCKRFANSSKWKQIGGDIIKETDFSVKKSSHTTDSSFRNIKWKPSKRNLRGLAKTSPCADIKITTTLGRGSKKGYRNISKIATFETVGNKCVQIMQAKDKTNEPLNDALSIVRAVDFVFCGIAIDKNGKIFEVIKHALDDCNNKIIRVANYHSELTERFNKYIKRGWSLGISIEQANQNYLKQRKVETKPSDYEYIKMEYHERAGVIKFIVLPQMTKKINSADRHKLICDNTLGKFGIYLKQINSHPIVYVEDGAMNGYNLNKKTALEICDAITLELKSKFIPKKKKKFQTAGDYGEMTRFAKEHLSADLNDSSQTQMRDNHKLKDMAHLYRAKYALPDSDVAVETVGKAYKSVKTGDITETSKRTVKWEPVGSYEEWVKQTKGE